MDQVEVALPTAPPGTANQLQPHGAIYPQISLLADKLLCPPAPKPTNSRRTWKRIAINMHSVTTSAHHQAIWALP